MSSPTQRSLAEMRRRGYPLVDVVERFIPFARVRKDLFGVGDILCVGDDIVIVQACADCDVSKRRNKINDSDAIAFLRKAGIRVLVQGWRKVKGRYRLREVDLS